MEQETQINTIITKLQNKDFGLYFFTLDTKGNPVAGVANIYEHVKILNELGYKAYILHEKNDYKLVGDENGMGISDWLGSEYSSLPHISIESQQLQINPADFIIVPEVFANVMDQVKKFPCKKIVISQCYDYLTELLPIGIKWNIHYGFHDVITTSDKQADYLKGLFPGIKTHVVPVAIADYFKPNTLPKQPVVTIVTRNQGDAAKIAKNFYLRHGIYKWVTFKELRGLSKTTFAEELKKSCLAVWVDNQSAFGTFPLEAIECNTPVIGLIPNMIPEWMEETNVDGELVIKQNGIWTNTTLNLSDLIAQYLKVWLEDSIPEELLKNMETSKGKYTSIKQKEKINETYSILVEDRINDFKTMLTNLTESKTTVS